MSDLGPRAVPLLLALLAGCGGRTLSSAPAEDDGGVVASRDASVDAVDDFTVDVGPDRHAGGTGDTGTPADAGDAGDAADEGDEGVPVDAGPTGWRGQPCSDYQVCDLPDGGDGGAWVCDCGLGPFAACASTSVYRTACDPSSPPCAYCEEMLLFRCDCTTDHEPPDAAPWWWCNDDNITCPRF